MRSVVTLGLVSCLACELTSGDVAQPGGTLHGTRRWVVAHCVGPLGLGTLLVKPRRHVISMAELDEQEAMELGPLLARTAQVVRGLVEAEQIYVCLWSHSGAVPGHIHYVVQPVTREQVTTTGLYGPALQMHMFTHDQPPAPHAVEALAPHARRLFAAART